MVATFSTNFIPHDLDCSSNILWTEIVKVRIMLYSPGPCYCLPTYSFQLLFSNETEGFCVHLASVCNYELLKGDLKWGFWNVRPYKVPDVLVMGYIYETFCCGWRAEGLISVEGWLYNILTIFEGSCVMWVYFSFSGCVWRRMVKQPYECLLPTFVVWFVTCCLLLGRGKYPVLCVTFIQI
jgi:hypothetical protein